MKMTGTGLGGWDVPVSSFGWQLKQMRRGRGILVFDDGWHKFATVLWEHDNGVRGVWDITLAMDAADRARVTGVTMRALGQFRHGSRIGPES